MRGHNYVLLSGNIGGKVVVGHTNNNDPACSFSVASDDGDRATWVRINAYGSLANACSNKIQKGVYVSVAGELMNRAGRCGELTEVRARDIIFFPMNAGDHDEQEQESEYSEYSDTWNKRDPE